MKPAKNIWLALGFGATLWLALSAGAVSIPASDWQTLLGGEALTSGAHVLWAIRLPRVALALLAGAALGLSGALAQGLFRNPLADPGLLGVSGGAACAAALVLVAAPVCGLALPDSSLPLAAFCGALLVALWLERFARWLAPGSISALLLSGIALNALAAALIGLCTYLADDEQLRSLSFWMLGSLSGASWGGVVLLALALAMALPWLSRLGRALNALALGEAAARHVGIEVARLRNQSVFWVALLCALVVAGSGMIGFVGLVAPHLARLAYGADQRRVLPLAMVLGAWLLLLADTLGRTMAIPAEIPVGIFSALLGAPFFLFLLWRARQRIA